ncbi:hypothetical protein [Bacteroides acidifaciens]|uniref:hypothetical protein n=1 Tax=Bacteroides acidifaciens TaxID=85831 RepID=UPI0026E9F05B|nr:hypothetical protein [Bacteroides acidifaciens]
MAVKKVELSDKNNVPVYFHTSADIVYFNPYKYKEAYTVKQEFLGRTAEDVVLDLTRRVNEMIELNEDISKRFYEMKAECKKLEDALGASTVLYNQSAYISPDYFTGTDKDEPPYTAILKVAAVRSTDTVIISPVQNNDVPRAQAQLESYNCISNLIIGDGTITLKCYEMKPVVGVPVQIVILRTKGN